MNRITRTALIALSLAGVGSVSLAPAQAQQADGGFRIERVEHSTAQSFRPNHPRMAGGMNQSGIVGMLLSARGAEAIDIAAVRLTYALDLTEAQQGLLDDLRVAALDAQSEVDAAREDIAPVAEAEFDQTELIARYAGVVAMTTARAEALESLQEPFEAFVASLTDEQVTQLAPRQGMNDRRGPGAQAPVAPQPDAIEDDVTEN